MAFRSTKDATGQRSLDAASRLLGHRSELCVDGGLRPALRLVPPQRITHRPRAGVFSYAGQAAGQHDSVLNGEAHTSRPGHRCGMGGVAEQRHPSGAPPRERQ